MASPCGLGISQYDGWVLRGEVPRGSPWMMRVFQESQGSRVAFYDLTSEITQHHFHLCLVVKAVYKAA